MVYFIFAFLMFLIGGVWSLFLFPFLSAGQSDRFIGMIGLLLIGWGWSLLVCCVWRVCRFYLCAVTKTVCRNASALVSFCMCQWTFTFGYGHGVAGFSYFECSDKHCLGISSLYYWTQVHFKYNTLFIDCLKGYVALHLFLGFKHTVCNVKL